MSAMTTGAWVFMLAVWSVVTVLTVALLRQAADLEAVHRARHRRGAHPAVRRAGGLRPIVEVGRPIEASDRARGRCRCASDAHRCAGCCAAGIASVRRRALMRFVVNPGVVGRSRCPHPAVSPCVRLGRHAGPRGRVPRSHAPRGNARGTAPRCTRYGRQAASRCSATADRGAGRLGPVGDRGAVGEHSQAERGNEGASPSGAPLGCRRVRRSGAPRCAGWIGGTCCGMVR